MLTSKQRAYLRGLASRTKTVSDALEARELIKLSVLETCSETPREAAEALADATGAEVVGVIGRKVILYRESVEHKKIEL